MGGFSAKEDSAVSQTKENSLSRSAPSTCPSTSSSRIDSHFFVKQIIIFDREKLNVNIKRFFKKIEKTIVVLSLL